MLIRILIVDDSVVVRKVLCEILSGDPQLEVAGTASDGRIALAKIAQLHPDLVTLDVEMPVLNGLETLTEIRKLYPKLPVVMFSTLTERGAAITLDALSLGASDYVAKPARGGPAEAAASIQAQLIPKIKALCSAPENPTRTGTVSLPRPRSIAPRKRSHRRIEILAIGTSTGGPNALAAVIPLLPKDFPVPVVIVQHMPPVFTRLLAERLTSHSNIPVSEGFGGVALRSGHAWIAPGDFHMKLESSGINPTLQLNQERPENSCRPAVDVLFRSVAEVYGSSALAVVMTGMGSDGVAGARAIRDQGGTVIIQDEVSSVVWGMPGLVHGAGLDEASYPLDQLGREIVRRVEQSRSPASFPLAVPNLPTLESRIK